MGEGFPVASAPLDFRSHDMKDARVAGTTLRFRPGVLVGGASLAHDCGRERAIPYFAEALILMAMFSKKVRPPRSDITCHSCDGHERVRLVCANT